MKTIAYLRVSCDSQDLEKNKADILTLAHDKDLGKVEFVQEKVSGTTDWRARQIGKVIENDLGAGDCLIVSELSRIGRSMLEIMEMLSVAQRKEIKIYSVKGGWHLDDSLQSKVMAMAFSIAAEIERDLISSRTKEALKARKKKGLPMGRPKGPGKSKLDEYEPEIRALLANGTTKAYIARRYETTQQNLYKWLRKKGI